MTTGSLTRWEFLQHAALVGASVAVGGTGWLSWRSVDGGVFATGTGPAYAPWTDWDQAGPPALAMVRAAILSASAHNSQPWWFRLSEQRIDLHADPTRTLGALDPLHRELYLSLGCCLENLALTGPAHGRTVAVTVTPDPADPTHVARLDLSPGPTRILDLYPAIPLRHTHRAGYRDRPVPAADLDHLAALVDDDPALQLTWLTGRADRDRFGQLTVAATQAIIADPHQAADDYAWYRSSWAQTQSRRDGITIDASGQPQLIRALAKTLPVSRQQNHDGWLRATRDVQVPTAAAIGVLTVTDPPQRFDPRAWLAAGRGWQRLHLAATLLGLAVQPLCQLPERIDAETAGHLPPTVTGQVAALLGTERRPVFCFRIGHPTTDPLASPRRPLAAVLRA